MSARSFGLLALVGVLTSTATAEQPVKMTALTAEPAQVTLTHADDQQRLLITGKLADGSLRDRTRGVKYISGNSDIAAVSPQGLVMPKSVGQTTIEVADSESRLRLSVPVTVKDMTRRSVSFANDVMPILAKTGCNSGACHGAASGKKGFKVSLRGYDPPVDYLALTRGTTGRRVNLNEPGNSLLLLKPTGQVPHEGGKRFDAHSAYAQTLQRWMAEGAGSDTSSASRLVKLEVSPSFRTFAEPRLEQQLLVVAHYSDGSRRDVTADAVVGRRRRQQREGRPRGQLQANGAVSSHRGHLWR